MIRSSRLSVYDLRRGLMVVIAAVMVFAALPERPLAAGETPAVTEPAAQEDAVRVVEIPVEGMSCFSCAATVKNRVKGLTGVIGVEVSLVKRSARVTYSPDLVTPDRIAAAIDQLGYTAGTPKEAQ